MIDKFLIILANLVVFSYGSGCRHMARELELAERIQEANGIITNKDRADGRIVGVRQPGGAFFTERVFPKTLITAMNNATTIILAEQLYAKDFLGDDSIGEIVQKIKSLTPCVALKDRCLPNAQCNPNDRFRAIDGSCNSLNDPNVGESNTQYTRLLPPVYEDGFYKERVDVVTGGPLLSPRIVCNDAYQAQNYPERPKDVFNVGGVFFGQVIAHDGGRVVNFGSGAGGQSIQCCTQNDAQALPRELTAAGCSPIMLPKNDPFFSKFNMTCMNFLRGELVQPNNCQLGPGVQLDASTGYLDASTVYGDTTDKTNTLRLFKGGRLQIDSENILFRGANCTDTSCYILGDSRMSTAPPLLQQQSILVRLHNFLADELRGLNGQWNDERLFQEARRIMIAIYQNIAIREWLQIAIGKDEFNKYFDCNGKTGYCGQYQPNLQGGTFSEFASAALRYFHVLVPNEIFFFSSPTAWYKRFALSDVIVKQTLLAPNYMGILLGALYQPANFDGVASQMRNQMFKGANGAGLDIPAIDLARARDYGVPPYYIYVQYCVPNVKRIESWKDLEFIIAPKDIELLRRIYSSVFDLDLGVGLFMEKKDGYLGPVGKCIFNAQFYRYTYGDRFYYRVKNGAKPFNKGQLNEILSINYARVLCQVTAITEVPMNALLVPSATNPIVQCAKIPKINLRLWKSTNKCKA